MPTKLPAKTAAKKTTPARRTSRPDEEIWESTIPGRVSLAVDNGRGGTKGISVKGQGQLLRLTSMDRELAEEVVRDPANNPFRNGALVRIDKGEHQASHDELSDADLGDLFGLDQSDFEAIVPTLSELNVRRLRAMAPVINARHAQVEYLGTYVEEHYAIGGSMPTWDEMQAKP